MSWQFVPGQFRVPESPICPLPPEDIWRGTGSDEGLFAFMPRGGNFGNRIISRQFHPSLVVEGLRLDPVYTEVNGWMYWSDGRYSHVYYTLSWGWVYARGVHPGYEPLEEYDYGRQEYTGDEFYTVSSLPSSDGATGRLRARGMARRYGDSSLQALWPRWTSPQEFGVYQAEGGESGTRTLGLPRWRGSDGVERTRSLKKTSGYFTYGDIRRVGTKWQIGTSGSEAGWHEGSEPKPGSSATFRFMKNQGSEATGSDITLSFLGYYAGEEADEALVGEVALWR